MACLLGSNVSPKANQQVHNIVSTLKQELMCVTVLKQMRMMYQGGYSEEERLEYREVSGGVACV